MSRHILHATDFSPASRPAFERALDLARARDADLLLVHVITRGELIPADFRSARAYREIRESAHRRAGQELEARRARAAAAGVRATPLVVEGSPAREIVAAARRHGAELVVVGTHGRTGVARFFVGSVASRVVATSPVPVVTVPPTARGAGRRAAATPRRRGGRAGAGRAR